MDDDDAEAVEALGRLGLSTYEAQVFVALQKLGTGSASEVSEVSEVPRSQVYGAAEALEEHGLVDVQRGTPTRYRPIGLDEARSRLLTRIESAGDRAFAHLERVRGTHSADGEHSESIWIVEGSDNVADRTVELLADAARRIVYAPPDRSHLEPAVVEALERRADELSVSVVSADRAVLSVFEDSPVAARAVTELATPDVRTGRLLLVDGDAVLLSVLPAGSVPGVDNETAFWSAETAFAGMLVAIFEEWIASLVGDRESDSGGA